jgi:uncharacterized caspase-like protein
MTNRCFGQICLVIAIGAAVFTSCGTAQASKKVALVIGNSAYRSVPALSNPLNDARELGDALARLGFSVSRVNNATYDKMRRAFLEFGRVARNAETAVVFYAGHGIEVGGENWLIPIDAELKSDTDVDHEAIGLKGAMGTVESASRLGLVILDACRNNPFQAKMHHSTRTRSVSRGLVQVEPSGNVLVAYSAKDGTLSADGEGRHSPFTAALLRHIETPGLEVGFLFRNVRDDVMKATNREQQPFVYGSLPREAIYLHPNAPATVAVPATEPAAAPAPTPDIEVAYWNSIRESTNIGELESYLKSYPYGVFAALAKLRIAELKRRAEAADRDAPPLGPVPKGSKCFSFQGRQFCE